MKKHSREESWQTVLRTTGKSIASLAALTSLLALLTSNILLLKQNRVLRGQLLKKGQQYLSAGNLVPTLRGLDLNNRITTITYERGDKATLLLVFSPYCGWCKINLPNWQAILDQVSGRYRIVAISIVREGTAEYANKYGLSRASVIVEPEPRDLLAYKFQLTPQTILVNPTGTVKKNWLGAFGLEERQDIERTLGVRLPSSYFDEIASEISAGRSNNNHP